jgi:hypothetical protein
MPPSITLLLLGLLLAQSQADGSRSIPDLVSPVGEGLLPVGIPHEGSVVDEPLPAVTPIHIRVDHPSLQTPVWAMLPGVCVLSL